MWEARSKVSKGGKENAKTQGGPKIKDTIANEHLFNKQGSMSNLKMRRIADKLSEMTGKYQGDRRKPRLPVEAGFVQS